MQSKRVELNVEQGLANVLLNRPDKHNALDMPMYYAIVEVIKRIKKDKNIRVVIVSGKGESFCSGLDVKSVMGDRRNVFNLLRKWPLGRANVGQKVTVGWRELSVPVIMVLHGKCWGGGMQIALGGDFRIASPNTSLSIMEAKWGLIPDMGGTLGLMENVSVDRAMLMAMTAEPVSAEEALNYKLITQVEDNPMEEATRLAKTLIERSPDTNREIKRFYQSLWSGKQAKVLRGETLKQWKIILGKNRQIAVNRAMGDKSDDYV